MRNKTALFACVFAYLLLLAHLHFAHAQGSAAPAPDAKTPETKQGEETKPLKIEQVGGPLVEIPAKLGDDTSFVGTVELIAGSAVHKIYMQSGVLKGDQRQPLIQTRQVALALTAVFDLDADTPKDVAVKITGVKDPGTYTGELHFFVPGKGLKPAVTVPIELTVHSDPAVTLCKGSDSITLQFVKCSCVGCLIAGFIQPEAVLASRLGSQGNSQSVCLINGSRESFSMNGALQARGVTNRQILGDALKTGDSTAQNVDVQSKFVNVPLTFAASPVADHYVGSINFYSADKLLTTVPLDVNVKSGPLLPLLALVAGIGLGRLLKYLQDKGNAQSDLLLAFYQLESRIASSPPDLALLQPALADLKLDIYSEQLDDAKTNLAAIQNRWQLLNTLRILETTLTPQSADAAVLAILNRIPPVRQLIEARQDAAAEAAVTLIQTNVANLHTAAVAAATPQRALFSTAKSQADRAKEIASDGLQPAKLRKPPLFGVFLSKLTGAAEAIRAQVTLWLMRPLVFILLVLALCATGLQQLYLKNATFGANPFSDYFGLFVWAISSDVASRTLSNLKTGS